MLQRGFLGHVARRWGPILDVGSLRSRSTDGPALLKFSALNVGLFSFNYSSAVGIDLDNR